MTESALTNGPTANHLAGRFPNGVEVMHTGIGMTAVAGVAIAMLAACGSDKSTGPAPLGQPVVTQVNGVSEPVGLIGMTVILEGSSLGDSARGKVYFLGSSGVKIQAPASVCDYAASGPRTAYTDR
jgi:hypothetical protein